MFLFTLLKCRIINILEGRKTDGAQSRAIGSCALLPPWRLKLQGCFTPISLEGGRNAGQASPVTVREKLRNLSLDHSLSTMHRFGPHIQVFTPTWLIALPRKEKRSRGLCVSPSKPASWLYLVDEVHDAPQLDITNAWSKPHTIPLSTLIFPLKTRELRNGPTLVALYTLAVQKKALFAVPLGNLSSFLRPRQELASRNTHLSKGTPERLIGSTQTEPDLDDADRN